MGHVGSQGEGKINIGWSLLQRATLPGPAYCSPVNGVGKRCQEDGSQVEVFAAESGEVKERNSSSKWSAFPCVRAMACAYPRTQVSGMVLKFVMKQGSERRLGLPLDHGCFQPRLSSQSRQPLF